VNSDLYISGKYWISKYNSDLNYSGKNTNIKEKHILCVFNYISGNNLISFPETEEEKDGGFWENSDLYTDLSISGKIK